MRLSSLHSGFSQSAVTWGGPMSLRLAMGLHLQGKSSLFRPMEKGSIPAPQGGPFGFRMPKGPLSMARMRGCGCGGF